MGSLCTGAWRAATRHVLPLIALPFCIIPLFSKICNRLFSVFWALRLLRGPCAEGMGEAGAFFDYMAPSCRERRPRRSAQQNTGFRITSGESAAAPLPAADAPTNADVGRIRKRVADSPNVVPCRGCCCAERASPFPTGGQVRIRRGLDHAFGRCCGGCRGRHPLQGSGCGFAEGRSVS